MKSNAMTPIRRSLMLRVMDSDTRIIPYLFRFDQFYRCDEILSWLIDNRITGKTFIDWAKFTFQNFQVEIGRFVLMQIDKTKDKKLVLNNGCLMDN